MTLLRITLHPTDDPDAYRMHAVLRCDTCGWTTDEPRQGPRGRPMRLRPRKPVPGSGPVAHECEACAMKPKPSQSSLSL